MFQSQSLDHHQNLIYNYLVFFSSCQLPSCQLKCYPWPFCGHSWSKSHMKWRFGLDTRSIIVCLNPTYISITALDWLCCNEDHRWERDSRKSSSPDNNSSVARLKRLLCSKAAVRDRPIWLLTFQTILGVEDYHFMGRFFIGGKIINPWGHITNC